MKKSILILLVTSLSSFYSCAQETDPTPTPLDPFQVQTNPQDQVQSQRKKIKLAILLDTSNSMDGLIAQAKNQLWKIVNQLAKAKDPDGIDPEIDIALYQYGNDGLSVYSGYVQQVMNFTGELDDISEQLFALRTNGGSEYCGTVIQTSLQELQWSDSPDDLQFIFIAGNEAFTQGQVSYQLACGMANQQNVIVNTIFCGNYNQGINTGWKDGADLGKGRYMNIDSDAKTIHYTTQYDPRISQLNIQLNQTYIPYGAQGTMKKEKQIHQDEAAESLGSANYAKRAISKSSKVYRNASWDLVDAMDEKSFKLEEVQTNQLPGEMRSLNPVQLEAYVNIKKNEREQIKKQISELNKKREADVAQQKAKDASASGSNLDDAIIQAIVDQAKSKRYSFED